jgi:hypothetical protein
MAKARASLTNISHIHDLIGVAMPRSLVVSSRRRIHWKAYKMWTDLLLYESFIKLSPPVSFIALAPLCLLVIHLQSYDSSETPISPPTPSASEFSCHTKYQHAALYAHHFYRPPRHHFRSPTRLRPRCRRKGTWWPPTRRPKRASKRFPQRHVGTTFWHADASSRWRLRIPPHWCSPGWWSPRRSPSRFPI